MLWLISLLLPQVQVRRVLDVMRGRSFEDAIIMMEYMPYRACEEILRALKSVSNIVTSVC
jgi:hypothetical protein